MLDEYKEVEADDSYYSPDVPTDVGTYTVRATIEETDNYFGGSATCDFSITQATPTDYSKPTNLMASYGDKLSSVILPVNWTWKSTDDLVGDAGNREHVAIYNPEDKNYKDVEVSLTVLVKDSSTPTPDPTPGPTPDSNPDSSSYSNPDSSSYSDPDSSSYSNPDSNPEPTPEPSDNNNNLPVGAIVGIAVGSTVVAGIGGFALVWFVIKKKSWADLLAIFKKK